jgi:hypothetical protein
MMRRNDAITYCQREADRLRRMLPGTTTELMKARLIGRIEELQLIATDEAAQPPDFEMTIAKSRW